MPACCCLAAAVPIYGLYYYVRDTVGLRWRKWMTTWFLDRYFAQQTYYRSSAAEGIDNPISASLRTSTPSHPSRCTSR